MYPGIKYPLLLLLFVFNGRGEEWNDQDLPAILKNVRPRPVDPRVALVEGSGAPIDWSDDEDIGMEGSASELDTMDQENKTNELATVKEDTTNITTPSGLHRPTLPENTPSPQENVDHVIESATANIPDSSSTMLLLPLFIVVVLTRF